MKTFIGHIVSVKQQHTVVVKIVRKTRHPLYKKLLTVSEKHNVDTAGMTLHMGDEVKIVEIRPLSKTKHFKVLEVIKNGTA